jgi:hypothetical protein
MERGVIIVVPLTPTLSSRGEEVYDKPPALPEG